MIVLASTDRNRQAQAGRQTEKHAYTVIQAHEKLWCDLSACWKKHRQMQRQTRNRHKNRQNRRQGENGTRRQRERQTDSQIDTEMSTTRQASRDTLRQITRDKDTTNCMRRSNPWRWEWKMLHSLLLRIRRSSFLPLLFACSTSRRLSRSRRYRYCSFKIVP